MKEVWGLVFVQCFLKTHRRRSTLLGVPRATLELKEVRGGSGMVGTATGVKNRCGSRGSFEADRRRSRLNQKLVKVAGVRAWSWVPRRTQGWSEKKGFGERE